jgi:hypothetical protein
VVEVADPTKNKVVCMVGSKRQSTYLGIASEERLARLGALQAV